MKLTNIFGKKTKQAPVIFNPRYEPDPIAPYITVARMNNAFDSARSGYTNDLFALYRDIIITDSRVQSELMKRKMGILGDKFGVRPYDANNPDDVAAASTVEDAIANIKNWRLICAHLLDATIFPVSLIEKVFTSDSTTRPQFKIANLIPVPYQLLDYATGFLRVFDLSDDGRPLSTTHEADPDRYIIHRGHLFTVYPDQWGGPMRSIVVWWMLANMAREWWARFLERYGSPFLVGYAETADDRTVLKSAMQWAVKVGGLVVSPNTRVEIKETSASMTGDAYENFQAICYREITRAIIGQTMSTEAQATGMGSGVADLHGEIRSDIKALDSELLAATLRDQLIEQFCRINNIPGTPPHIAWASISTAEKQATANLLTALKGAGLEPADDAIQEISDSVGFQLQRAAPAMPLQPFRALSANNTQPIRTP